MCGICGVASLAGPLDPRVLTSLPAMADAIRHRGPDGDGFFTDANGLAALAHRRLAIIDLATGAQPIPNEDGSMWIVFNGEIYNHHELRGELEARGHRYRTTSDTETILHAFEEYGERCLDRLEGMFAVAIWNSRTRELWLARDRLGKKPLFWARLGSTLHFASEIKSLQASPLWDGTIDDEGLEAYLSLGYYPAPATVYRHVRKLQPAHWLRLKDGHLEMRRYWDVTEFDTDHRPEPEIVADLSARLGSAVRERLESEVPLGAFLSGGIDSGLVVSYMAEASARVLTTSVGFGDREHNELTPAEATARRYGTTHRAHVIEPDLRQDLDRIVQAFDEPFADASAIPTYYLAGAARQSVTVALSGDGGDEAFGGYDFRYLPHLVESRARRLLPSWGRHALGTLAAHWPASPRLPRYLRLATTLHNVAVAPEEAYYFDLCFAKPATARRLLGRPNPSAWRETRLFDQVATEYRRCPSPSPVQRAQFADLHVYMPNDPLVKVDRMSMLHGLEVRSPFLDRRLVEFAFRIPTALKLKGLEGKHLLKQLARTRLPVSLLGLPKHGFTAPVGRWIGATHAEWFASDVLSNRSALSGHVDLSTVRQMHRDHVAGRANHAFALWALWMFERWSQVGAPALRAQVGVA